MTFQDGLIIIIGSFPSVHYLFEVEKLDHLLLADNRFHGHNEDCQQQKPLRKILQDLSLNQSKKGIKSIWKTS